MSCSGHGSRPKPDERERARARVAGRAAAPVRALSREVASFQRELDRELAEALEPRAGPGLEVACHRDPIVWMHFLAAGGGWRLLSVDERGQAAVWSARGLEQTWSLHEAELEWVRRVALRQDRSEDADWLFARAKLPGDECRSAICASTSFSDIAARDDRRWIGVRRHHSKHGNHRITASGDWFAIGDAAGNLSVARTHRHETATSWAAPACEDLRWADVGGGNEPPPLVLVTDSYDREYRRYIDVRLGIHTLVFADELQRHYEIADVELGLNRLMLDESAPSAQRLLDQLFHAAPDLAWEPVRFMTLSSDHRWLAAAGASRWVLLEDTLWIGIASEWESFAPLDTRLLRLEPGGVVEAYPIAGFETIERVLGRMPGSLPTLVVLGGGVVGIVRLTDGALLRLIIHDRGMEVGWFPAAPWTADGLSFIWLDADGRERCRFDGADDDHAPSRGARIADAAVLMNAFLSGGPCPQ